MNNKALTLSIIMALLAFFFVEEYVTSVEERVKKEFGTEVFVVVSTKDIQEMETLDETKFKTIKIPKQFLEPSAFSYNTEGSSESITKDLKKLSGSVALVPIKTGEQISINKISEPGIRTGLSPEIVPGRRAVAIPVTEVTGVSKLVKPSDRVDVIAVIGGRELGNNKIVRTVLQDVRVLAVGRNITNNQPRLVELAGDGKGEKIRSLSTYDGFSAITLEVEPYQAQLISYLLSDSQNRLMVSLRNNDDTEAVPIPSVTLIDVLGSDANRFAPRAPASAPVMPQRMAQ